MTYYVCLRNANDMHRISRGHKRETFSFFISLEMKTQKSALVRFYSPMPASLAIEKTFKELFGHTTSQNLCFIAFFFAFG